MTTLPGPDGRDRPHPGQKLLPAQRLIDVRLAVALIALALIRPIAWRHP